MVSDSAQEWKKANFKPEVLILVLMEYGLGRGNGSTHMKEIWFVLILVLMEYGLGPLKALKVAKESS